MFWGDRSFIFVAASLISLYTLFGFTPVVFGDTYSATDYWVNVPELTTFIIRMPIAYRSLPINETAEGSANVTHWISFNDTGGTGTANCLEPRTEGVAADEQDGNTRPIFWVENTGNVGNVTIWMRVNATNASQGFIMVNSSCGIANGCEQTITGSCANHCCATPLINTSYIRVIELNATGTPRFGNISLYTNISNIGQGNFGPRRIFMNSTKCCI